MKSCLSLAGSCATLANIWGELVVYMGGWMLDSRGTIEKRAVGV